jgi:uncharacterized protein YcfJ
MALQRYGGALRFTTRRLRATIHSRRFVRRLQMKKAVSLFFALVALPILTADVSFAKLTQSEKRYCQREAERYADRRAASNTVGGAIGGAVVGGILGGVIGGGSGRDVGTGAAIGAGVGGVGGAVRSSQRWRDYYWREYNRCANRLD